MWFKDLLGKSLEDFSENPKDLLISDVYPEEKSLVAEWIRRSNFKFNLAPRLKKGVQVPNISTLKQTTTSLLSPCYTT